MGRDEARQSKKRYHHGDLKASLIVAALAGLDANGEVPTMRGLAGVLSVSRAAAYRHFSDRSDLMAHVTARCFDEMICEIDAAVDLDELMIEQHRRACAAYLSYGVRYASRYDLMFGRDTLMHENAVARQARDQAFSKLIAMAGDTGADDPELLALTVWSTLHGGVDLLRRAHLPVTNQPEPAAVIQAVLNVAVQTLWPEG
ncbi:MAG: TetR/AcrR family transcriptional regulator [Myxococcota bacterium]